MEIIVGYLFGVLYFKCMQCVHTAYIYKIKEEHLPELSVYRIWRKSLRTQERVRLIHSKRAIGVRAIEVLLYMSHKGRNLPSDMYAQQRFKSAYAFVQFDQSSLLTKRNCIPDYPKCA